MGKSNDEMQTNSSRRRGAEKFQRRQHLGEGFESGLAVSIVQGPVYPDNFHLHLQPTCWDYPCRILMNRNRRSGMAKPSGKRPT